MKHPLRGLSIDPQNKIARNGMERLVNSKTRVPLVYYRTGTIERHNVILAKKGLQYRGTRKAESRSRRTTHCWRCRHPLDNDIDVECVVCGWILCGCGACGCSRA